MKTKALALALFFNLIFAKEAFIEQKAGGEERLSYLIERMKKADRKERYIYMNKIKMILRNMNYQKRAEIIKELRKSFAKGRNNNILHKNHNKLGNFKNHEMNKGHGRQRHGKR